MATYKIKTGDTIGSIAKKKNTKASEIAALNGITDLPSLYTSKPLEIPQQTNTPSNTYTPTYNAEANKPIYQKSDALINAENALAQQESNKPQNYQSQYSQQIDSLLDSILNRQQFNYDFNADPIYQQYKNQYTALGNQAMMDTMGNAAALSGGYGNSYASTAGNQAYQAYLSQLNNVIPELYNQAYNRYLNEGESLYNQIGVLQGLENADYGKYRDTVSDYYNDLNYFFSKYNTMSQDEYNRYLNDLSAWQADRAYYYNKAYDEQQQANWQNQFDYNKEYDLQQQQNWQDQFDYNAAYDAQQQQNWQNQFDYSKEYDALQQQNWQNQFDYNKEQDAQQQANWQAQFDYSKEYDALQQQNWQNQFDYNKEQDALQQQNWQNQFDYGKEYDAQQQANWQAQFDYNKEYDAQQQANWQAQFDYDKEYDAATLAARYSGGGGSGGSNTSSAVEDTTYEEEKPVGYNYANIKTTILNEDWSREYALDYIQDAYDEGLITEKQKGYLEDVAETYKKPASETKKATTKTGKGGATR